MEQHEPTVPLARMQYLGNVWAEAWKFIPEPGQQLRLVKRPLDQLPAVGRAITHVEGVLGREGRVLVRYSGTEAKARVMIEGTDETEIRAHADEIARVMKVSLGG